MAPRTLEEKSTAFLELLDERTQRLAEGMDDLRNEHKSDRLMLTEIQGSLRQMQGEALATKIEKLDVRCFGDSINSLDNRIRIQENWRWKVIGMGIAAGSVAGAVVGLIMMLISKRL